MVDAGLMLVPFAEARLRVRDADLLLYRRRGLISIAGRGDHTHAAKAAWWGDDLFCLEVREWHGGRAHPCFASGELYVRGVVEDFDTNRIRIPVVLQRYPFRHVVSLEAQSANVEFPVR